MYFFIYVWQKQALKLVHNTVKSDLLKKRHNWIIKTAFSENSKIIQ